MMKFLFIPLLLAFNCFSAEKTQPDFSKILKSYDKLYNAYLKQNHDQVKKSAGSLLEEISQVNDDNISKALNFSKKKLEAIQRSSQLIDSYDALNIVSQALFATAKKYSKLKGYSRYYCPMVKKYWMQPAQMKKTNNPYAVKTMPHCGSKK